MASMTQRIQTEADNESGYPKIRKNIYELDVYEITLVEVTKDLWIGVTRVPGGWIHLIKGNPVFVPYSEEYKGNFTGKQYGI